VKYPDLSSAMRPVPHSGEFPTKNLAFSDNNSAPDEDHG